MTDNFPSFPTPLPPARKRRSGWLALVLGLLVVGGASLAWRQQWRPGPRDAAIGVPVTDSSARAPAGERIQVRVINATSTRGLARRATMVLRDFGYDVVDFDTDPRRKRGTTLVQVHTGKQEIGERIVRVLAVGEVQPAVDSLRYLDFTILIGSDWKPPAQPLRP